MSAPGALAVTAAICTRNRPADLDRALQSLASQTRPPERILVVDDSDPPQRAATERACRAQRVPVEVVVKERPGLTASRNLALDRCDTDLIAYFDDDVVLRPDYLAELVAAFEADPELAGAGGSIDDDHDYELPALRALLGIPGPKWGRVYRSGWSTQTPQHRTADVEHLVGCNMAFRTEVLRHHRFDPGFEGYALGEDLEATFRLHRAGHRLRVVGSARLWHLTRLPRHDRSWGYREVAIRPVVAGPRFRRWRFLVAAAALVAINAARNPERARGNVEGIRAVLSGRGAGGPQVQQKPTGEATGRTTGWG